MKTKRSNRRDRGDITGLRKDVGTDDKYIINYYNFIFIM
jgi:hypothetical protein